MKLIRKWLAGLIWAIIARMYPPPDPVIDVNEKCPGCGHRQGRLRCVGVETLAGGIRDGVPAIVQMEHICAVCEAKWYQDPVFKGEPRKVAEQIHPSHILQQRS